MKNLKKLEVYQECKDGRLDTAIINQLVEDGIINEEDRFNVIVNFFNKNNRANGKSFVQILFYGQYIFEVKDIYRFNTTQSCTLKIAKDWGKYLPM